MFVAARKLVSQKIWSRSIGMNCLTIEPFKLCRRSITGLYVYREFVRRGSRWNLDTWPPKSRGINNLPTIYVGETCARFYDSVEWLKVVEISWTTFLIASFLSSRMVVDAGGFSVWLTDWLTDWSECLFWTVIICWWSARRASWECSCVFVRYLYRTIDQRWINQPWLMEYDEVKIE